MFSHDDIEDDRVATMGDAVKEYAANVGAENRDNAWILSPYDSWERNPFYVGPPVRHPEDDFDEECEIDQAEGGLIADAAVSAEGDAHVNFAQPDDGSYDIPF